MVAGCQASDAERGDFRTIQVCQRTLPSLRAKLKLWERSARPLDRLQEALLIPDMKRREFIHAVWRCWS
jgi:hypothetical protein